MYMFWCFILWHCGNCSCSHLKPASLNLHGEDMPSEAAKSSPVKSLMLTETAKESQPRKKAWTTESTDSSKLQKHCNGEVRRSGRLRNAVVPSTNLLSDSEPLTAANDGDDEAPKLHKEEQILLPSPTEKNSEAKLDLLERKIEALLSAVNALQSKVQELKPGGCPRHADADNRTLHLDCKKKIDELMSANCNLTSKLDYTQSKLERYEKRQQLFSDVLDKLKNTILLFELSKAAEKSP